VFRHRRGVAELLLAVVALVAFDRQGHVPGLVGFYVRGQRRLVRAAAHGTNGLVVFQTVQKRVFERPVARFALRGAGERVRERFLLAMIVERADRRLVLGSSGSAFPSVSVRRVVIGLFFAIATARHTFTVTFGLNVVYFLIFYVKRHFKMMSRTVVTFGFLKVHRLWQGRTHVLRHYYDRMTVSHFCVCYFFRSTILKQNIYVILCLIVPTQEREPYFRSIFPLKKNKSNNDSVVEINRKQKKEIQKRYRVRYHIV